MSDSDDASTSMFLRLSQLIKIEYMIAGLLPAAAMLIIAVVGTQQMADIEAVIFTIVVIFCALLVFLGEWVVFHRLQRAMKMKVIDLTAACHEFLKGDKTQRIFIQGNDEISILAGAMNMVMDQQQESSTSSQKVVVTKVVNDDSSEIYERLRQLVNELYPALDGDLRVKATISEGLIGDVGDFCNALVEKMVQFTRWTLYSSEQTLNSARLLLERSIALAKNTEAEMVNLSQITGLVEQMVASVQRMGSSLQLGLDAIQETSGHLQQVKEHQAKHVLQPAAHEYDVVPRAPEPLELAMSDVARQVQLLEDIIQSLPETVHMAETVMNDLYTLVQQMHQSGTAILQTAEQIGFMINLAEEWQNLAGSLLLPAEEEAAVEQPQWLL